MLCVSAIELFGTLLLLKSIGTILQGKTTTVRIPLATDNRGNSFIVAKCFTTKWPASLILAELAACLVELNAEVHVEWRPREDNTWADALSKGDFTGFDPEKRCTFDLDRPDFFSVLPLQREKHPRSHSFTSTPWPSSFLRPLASAGRVHRAGLHRASSFTVGKPLSQPSGRRSCSGSPTIPDILGGERHAEASYRAQWSQTQMPLQSV